jgi:P4 family phage/plasmid primase-like protien
MSSEEGLNILIHFVKNMPNSYLRCISDWTKCKPDTKGIRTFRSWAKTDSRSLLNYSRDELEYDRSRFNDIINNPDTSSLNKRDATYALKNVNESLKRMTKSKYDIYIADLKMRLIDDIISYPGAVPMAKLLAFDVRDYMLTTKGGKNNGYVVHEFIGNRWDYKKAEVNLIKYLHNDIKNYLLVVLRSYELSKNDADKSSMQKDVIDKTIKRIRDKIIPFCTDKYTKVINTALYYLYDNHFEEVINENPQIFGCDNGVYDCRTLTFRKARPDDYNANTNGIRHDPDMISPEQKFKLAVFLRQLLPDKSVREYFMRFLSSLLISGNNDKIFVYFTGIGSNGKSIMVKLLQKVLGEYCKDLPTSILTCKEASSNGTNMELDMMFNGTRLNVISENDKTEPIKTAKVKKYTGNDRIYYRLNYKEGQNKVPSSIIVSVCNTLPPSANDPAFSARVVVIDFDSRFSSDASDNIDVQNSENVYLKDKFYDVDDIAPALLDAMFREFPKYMKYGLNMPKKIREATSRYNAENDIIGQFIDKFTEKLSDAEKKKLILQKNPGESLVSFNKVFTTWILSTYGKTYLIDVREFKNGLIQKWGYPKGSEDSWLGYRLKNVPNNFSNNDNDNNYNDTQTQMTHKRQRS